MPLTVLIKKKYQRPMPSVRCPQMTPDIFLGTMVYQTIESDCCLTPILPKQHSELDFYSVTSLKQQSAGRNVAPLAHIILIPSQPVFALSPKCCVLSGEATNTNCIGFGLIRPGLEPTIYRTRGEHVNHYATDVVKH